MKNLILAILTTISIGAHAQTLMGLKGGLSLTNISSKDFIPNTGSRNGFSGGLTFEYFLKNNHSLGVDLIYNQRGFTNDKLLLDPGGESQKATVRTNYDYLSLPLKMGVYIGKKGVVFGNIGVVPSLLVNAKIVSAAVQLPSAYVGALNLDITDKVNQFDLAGLAEIGLNFKTSDKLWMFGSVSYQYSFTSTTSAHFFSASAIQHYGVTSSFGIKLRLSKDD